MKKISKRILSILMAITLVLGVSTYEGAHTHVHADETHVHTDDCAHVELMDATEPTNATESTVVYGSGCAYDTVSGHYYLAVNASLDYYEAKIAAKDAEGYLVCISSAEENTLVNTLAHNAGLSSDSIWIGYQRSVDDENVWEWIDGSTSTYTNWNTGEPSSVDETVAQMYVDDSSGNGFWNDVENDVNYYCYVIEIDSCPHPQLEIVVENDTFTTCTEGGYTGDICCGLCDELLREGTTIEAGDHAKAVLDESTVVAPKCEEDGYSGDSICPTCETVITVGTVVAELEHQYVNNVCNNCGRIQNAELDATYDSYISEDVPFQIVEFTPAKSGSYSFTTSNDGKYWDAYGYLYNNADTLNADIEEAIVKISNRKEYVRLSNSLASNDDSNYTNMPAITYDLTGGITYYFVVGSYDYLEYTSGEFSVIVTCAHGETEVRNRNLANCIDGGYTGDTVCLTCDKTIENGVQITPNSAHGESVLDEDTVVGVTCSSNGYTGDYICAVCGVVTQEGEVIESQGHIPSEDVSGAHAATCYSAGYTGDILCQTCPEVMTEGTEIAQLEHKYEDDVCINCGRILNAVIDEWYYSETTSNMMYQVIEFTVPGNGKYNIEIYLEEYGTVYIFEKSDALETKIADAIVKCHTGEDVPYLSGALYEGYVYYDEYFDGTSLKKDTTYCLVVGPDGGYGDYGYLEVQIGCDHGDTYEEGKTITSCATGGYTGDIICNTCGKTVEEGMEVEPNSEHNYDNEVIEKATCKKYAEVKYTCIYCDYSYTETDVKGGYGPCDIITDGYVRPTCTAEGYSGDDVCRDCGYVESIGYEIPAIHDQTDEEGWNDYFYYGYHRVQGTCTVDSYTGDTICILCKEVIKEGETIKATGHTYGDDGVCTTCGFDEDFLTTDENGNYLIYTAEDLMKFICNADKSISGKLMEDITFPDNYQNDDWDYEDAYSTVLDGNNHTIENFNIDGYWFALFGNFDNSTVKNLTVVVNVEDHPDHSFGAIAQDAYGSTFDNCVVGGDVVCEEDQDDFGGFAGQAEECTFTNCTNNANISTKGGNVGGFIGDGEMNVYTNCVNNGNIHGDEDEIGGLAGQSDYSLFEQCTNNGDVTTKDEQAAGIVGVVYGSSIIECKNTGDIMYIGTGESRDEIGGIVGSAYEDSIIDGCENSGFVGCEDLDITLDEVGGIVGQIFDAGTITNCVNNGNVTAGGDYIGGIVGDIDYSYYDYENIDVTIDGCINNGDVYGTCYAGGVAGYSKYTTIANCINNGNITGIQNVAGISGYGAYNTIDNVYNTGAVEGCDEDNTASLIHGSEYAIITNSDGNHTKHNYVENILQPGTATSDGKVELVCKCGDKRDGFIERIGDVTLSWTTYEYTGKAITLPTVTIKNASGNTVISKHYTVTYLDATGKAVTAITEAGTYTVKITFKGAYSGEITKTITVNKATEEPTKVTNPDKTKITKAKNIKAKKVKLKWKKIADATGYEVRYATNKKFNKAKVKTIKKNKAKYTLKKLNKKKYFIQVRAYKVVDGTKYVGKWSKKTKVKMTK